MVVRRVNKLMDKGIKSIYEVTTASGKTIRTTGNHPYLVAPKNVISTGASLLNSAILKLRKTSPRVAVFIDAANLQNQLLKLGWQVHYRCLQRALESLGTLAHL